MGYFHESATLAVVRFCLPIEYKMSGQLRWECYDSKRLILESIANVLGACTETNLNAPVILDDDNMFICQTEASENREVWEWWHGWWQAFHSYEACIAQHILGQGVPTLSASTDLSLGNS
jgi:hypothetical protein